ncbi:MAG: hypothetical protein Q4D77_07105 [Peptostreptococcaceae bacterium]|nr:hypothetical protein [Peptostreptococcaceae bacterium]
MQKQAIAVGAEGAWTEVILIAGDRNDQLTKIKGGTLCTNGH